MIYLFKIVLVCTMKPLKSNYYFVQKTNKYINNFIFKKKNKKLIFFHIIGYSTNVVKSRMSYLISQGVVQDSWGYSVDQDDHQNQNNQNSQQNQNNQNSQQMQSNAMFFELNMSLQPKSKFIEQKIKESNNIIYLQDMQLSLGHSPEEDKQTLMIYVQNGAYFLYTIFKLLFEVNSSAFSKEFKYTVYPKSKANK